MAQHYYYYYLGREDVDLEPESECGSGKWEGPRPLERRDCGLEQGDSEVQAAHPRALSGAVPANQQRFPANPGVPRCRHAGPLARAQAGGMVHVRPRSRRMARPSDFERDRKDGYEQFAAVLGVGRGRRADQRRICGNRRGPFSAAGRQPLRQRLRR